MRKRATKKPSAAAKKSSGKSGLTRTGTPGKAAVTKRSTMKSGGTRSPAGRAGGARAAKKPPQSMPYEQGKWAHAFAARTPGERRYWLVKSEPDVFSFADLQAAPHRTTCWDSVRNTAARNFMRDGMKCGDLVFYYHSNAEPSAIVGICEVVREGYPDHTAFDPAHPYYDAESVVATPTWFMVDVKAVEALPRPVTLPEMKEHAELREMALIKVGRLSVVPVSAPEWAVILRISSGR
jgi:predicted RNA-binding protein with PUA-like domain